MTIILPVMASNINLIRRSELGNEQFIDNGTFSRVYSMAWNSPQLGPINVAAKILNNKDKHELEIWQGLDHENIVKFIGVADEGTEFMLILELCDGGSLRAYLDAHKDRRLSVDDFYTWAEQAARALEYLHERKLVHKDVKSKNYMVHQNILKLGDFGTAKNIEETIHNATQTASWAWMAPELMIKPYVLSPKYDIFALLVVVWELWTGKLPWKGFGIVVPYKICEKNERLAIPEDCPEPIKELMRHCWQRDWKLRPDIIQVLQVITSRPASSSASVSPSKFMGRQIMAASWNMVGKIGSKDGPGKLQSGYHMVLSPDENVVVADHTASQIMKYSRDGQCISTILSRIKPIRIALSSENTCFMTDNTKNISKYDFRDGKLKHSWQSFCPPASPAPKLIGLAIDHAGNLLLGDVENKYIYRHTQDGAYVNKMKVDIEPYYIAVTSHDTIVIGASQSAPQILSNDGKLLQIIKHPTESIVRTWDVCCSNGIIFVIASLSTLTNKTVISRFTESGKFIGTKATIVKKIAMTSDGKTLFIFNHIIGKKPVISVYTASSK